MWWPASWWPCPTHRGRRPDWARGSCGGWGRSSWAWASCRRGRGAASGPARPTRSATPGTLTAMVQQMAQVSQPSVTASWVRSFGSFQAGHGWLVNVVVVVLLVGVGTCFLSGDRRAVRIGVIVGAVLCLADWVLVQDFGFFGGVGTDPNSMIPMALVFTGGYVAMVRLPVRARWPPVLPGPRRRRPADFPPGRRPSPLRGRSRVVRPAPPQLPPALAVRHRGDRDPAGRRGPHGRGRHQPQRRPHPDRGGQRDPQPGRRSRPPRSP